MVTMMAVDPTPASATFRAVCQRWRESATTPKAASTTANAVAREYVR
jgi:hypothetical protein